MTRLRPLGITTTGPVFHVTVVMVMTVLVLGAAQSSVALEEPGRASRSLARIQMLPAPEQHAFAYVLFMVLAEQSCRSLLGRYVLLDELMDQGCTKGAARVPPMAQSADPRSMSEYLPIIQTAGDQLRIEMRPKGAGFAGFLFDGTVIRFDSKGAVGERGVSLGTPAELFGAR